MTRSRRSLVALALVGALAASTSGGDKSGPPVGEQAPTFDVEDLTGPNKGKTLCYV